jgi:hypothetical protein
VVVEELLLLVQVELHLLVVMEVLEHLIIF